ncbi:YchJ family protein [uncultured Thiodictyon sp.]|uniref:YchJ family protein n=1 Tax=uncultured Thiodictyon sp. TaxID=1846217 RepID=UPI0025DC59EB|nr:YchJ family protein [uncultured Thiodictyon sp.]
MNTQAPIPDPCPCGSALAYPDCCGPLIAGTQLPPTAERLMRSRYTAYTRGEADYLRATWHPTTRQQGVALDETVRWLGLKIMATQAGGADDQHGLVEFVARYKIGGRAHRLHERSRFKRLQGRWFYVDGELPPSSDP